MTTNHLQRWMIALLTAACITALHAQGTEFTYQGQLNHHGAPASGLYDLRFELFDAASSGTSLGTVTRTNILVSGGVFTVTLDFGPNIFEGAARWLEIDVRLSGVGEFALIEPRSKVTTTPRVIYAHSISGGAPLGVVIDWWRADAGTPIPEGYQVCDGSVVSDPESPLDGNVLPDLRGRFVMGSTDGATVGESGGSDFHTHSVDIDHDHANQLTSSGGSHAHNADLPGLTEPSRHTHLAGGHQHAWLMFINLDYNSWTADGSGAIMHLWTNGLDKVGSGYLPVCDHTGASTRTWYTAAVSDHQHECSINHDHSSFSSDFSPAHTHSMDLPGLGTLNKATNMASNLPPYYGLLKLMRIK